MKLAFTKTFIRDYRKLPQDIRELADKQLGLLLSSSRHPSKKDERPAGHLGGSDNNVLPLHFSNRG